MDMQNRPGAKARGGGVATLALVNAQRRVRQRKLMTETLDLSKDPCFTRNHIGMFECRLCLTMHANQASYIAHTLGDMHQKYLLKKNNRQVKDVGVFPQPPRAFPKRIIKIGRPGYKVTKQKDPVTQEYSLLFEIEYNEVSNNIQPRHRVMSCYQQTREVVDPRYQYVLFAADPYETIGFKVPNLPIKSSDDGYFCQWDGIKKIYTVKLTFKN